MAATDPYAERRRFHRIPLERPVFLTAGTEVYECELVDISLNGALMIADPEWSGGNGERVSLDIVLDDLGGASIHMVGEIAHIDDDTVGVHCQRLDLDSATLLRRLVEVNVADPDLLERDLAAMIDA